MASAEKTSSRNPAARVPTQFDRLIHSRVRLGILSALAGEGGPLSFNDLKAILDTSDGNLSTHARKLEDAGYLACRKTYEGRTPLTLYELTGEGRRALETYLDQMEHLIRTARNE